MYVKVYVFDHKEALFAEPLNTMYINIVQYIHIKWYRTLLLSASMCLLQALHLGGSCVHTLNTKIVRDNLVMGPLFLVLPHIVIEIFEPCA